MAGTITHSAVGIIGDPVGLRVSVEWTAGEPGFLLVLKDLYTLSDVKVVRAGTADPIPGETLSDSTLDQMVSDCLSPFRVIGKGWAGDAVSVAVNCSNTHEWSWVPEKFAS